ncbi:ABC transporter ATP-binding protein [Oerskovia flava]|uniref:ABC transporter ATP-binding protein n=1 Tax=Oerskovia flava TaxID=2986422 RepID=UPI002240D232|nr:ATP-binding cassette domain-containing protein [Oerskovia sp. JB1-3-2]
MSEASVLRANGLWAGYGGHEVLRGIDIELSRGAEPVGIVGPSGAGKTTVVRALLGDVKPTRGTATYASRTVSKLSRRDKKVFKTTVRAVSQNGLVGVEPRWTVTRTLDSALTDARKAGRANGQSATELLALVALEERYATRVVHSLSGGEKQRLALALALATRPDVLLLDEPLTAVDPTMRGDVVRSLLDVVSDLGTAVLLVSHDLEVVERMCPTVHVLADGEFVASGPLRDVLATGEHPVVRELAHHAPLAAQRFR